MYFQDETVKDQSSSVAPQIGVYKTTSQAVELARGWLRALKLPSYEVDLSQSKLASVSSTGIVTQARSSVVFRDQSRSGKIIDGGNRIDLVFDNSNGRLVRFAATTVMKYEADGPSISESQARDAARAVIGKSADGQSVQGWFSVDNTQHRTPEGERFANEFRLPYAWGVGDSNGRAFVSASTGKVLAWDSNLAVGITPRADSSASIVDDENGRSEGSGPDWRLAVVAAGVILVSGGVWKVRRRSRKPI